MIVHAIKNIDVGAMVLYGLRIESGVTAFGSSDFISRFFHNVASRWYVIPDLVQGHFG